MNGEVRQAEDAACRIGVGLCKALRSLLLRAAGSPRRALTKGVCQRSPQDHPQIECFSRKAHRIQHAVGLTAEMYYSKRTQIKISKGKKGA